MRFADYVVAVWKGPLFRYAPYGFYGEPKDMGEGWVAYSFLRPEWTRQLAAMPHELEWRSYFYA